MHLRFTQAARKHKIGKSRVRYVIENPHVTIQIPAGDDQPDNRTLYLGDDESGRAFEVLTVPIEDGELVITRWICERSTALSTTPRRRRQPHECRKPRRLRLRPRGR